MRKRIALLLLLAAAAAAQAQQLGQKMRLAPAPLGAARTEDILTALVPSGTGWITFFQRGRQIRAMGVDASGQPDYRWRQVLEEAEPYSFNAARTDRGLLALWRRDTALLVAPLGPDGLPSQPGRMLVPYGYDARLTCGPSRCLVIYNQGSQSTSGLIIDAFGNETGPADVPAGWVIASAADPDGFLLVMTDGERTTRVLRLDRDGRRMSETTIAEGGFLSAAADFDGEQYVVVTASTWNGPVRATAVSLEGGIVGSSVVYTPGPSVIYQAVGIAWSGTQHLVTIVDDESGIPVPTDSLAPSKLFAIRMARDLVPSDARAPIALGPETFASFWPFTAANGGSFFTAWIASNGSGAVGRGARIGPNGVAFTHHVLTLRPLDQEPAALSVGTDGPVAVWSELDGLAKRTTIRAGVAGQGTARTVAEVRYLWSTYAAAMDDELLVTWYASAEDGTRDCCASAAAVVTGSGIVPVSAGGLLADLRVAAGGRSRWMIVGYVREGIGAVLVDRDGKPVTSEPIVVARTDDARRYDVATDGDAFLVVSRSYAKAGVTVTLVDAEGRILHTARIADSGTPTVAWNGREYLVVLTIEGGFYFARVGPDGEPRGTPTYRMWNAPWAEVPSLAPFGDDWVLTLRTDRGRSLVRLSADFTELAVLPNPGMAAVAAGPDGRAYALASEAYEPAPYPTSIRAVVREVLP